MCIEARATRQYSDFGSLLFLQSTSGGILDDFGSLLWTSRSLLDQARYKGYKGIAEIDLPHQKQFPAILNKRITFQSGPIETRLNVETGEVLLQVLAKLCQF